MCLHSELRGVSSGISVCVCGQRRSSVDGVSDVVGMCL